LSTAMELAAHKRPFLYSRCATTSSRTSMSAPAGTLPRAAAGFGGSRQRDAAAAAPGDRRARVRDRRPRRRPSSRASPNFCRRRITRRADPQHRKSRARVAPLRPAKGDTHMTRQHDAGLLSRGRRRHVGRLSVR
jgi:hypothetical protein